MAALFGLLGEKLGHSFSPRIHRELGGYEYELIEVPPAELERFLARREFRGINVTIPYKRAVIPFLDELSPRARDIGSVNTVVRDSRNRLIGYNTDADGFDALLDRSGVNPAGKKALVLGSGGASRTAVACLQARGAREVRVISRSGTDHYGNLDRHADAEILVNATPVGMYPGNGQSPVSLRLFPRLALVLDLIYNPARTALILEAEALGIPALSGLPMLVWQAAKACERFLGAPVPPEKTESVLRTLTRETRNWILIGMPGCGKSTVGRLLAERTGREPADSDSMVEEAAGAPCGELIRRLGEAEFRRLETEALRRAGARTGIVLATGGGAVTRPENLPLLRQNGWIIHLDRPPETLDTGGDRPLSDSEGKLRELYRMRAPLYAAWRDLRVEAADPGEAVRIILEAEEKLQ